jgi:ABC-2 type transport system ATP-binding protein
VPGGVVAVISPEPRRLRDFLTGSEGVSNMVLVGDGLHLMVDDAAKRVPELRLRLASANLPFDRIEEIAPTIEDLFVQAVGSGAARVGSE